LRTAGSLKLGWVTASLLIAKLQSSRRKNALTCGIQEYGRLNKTIFILRYLLTEQVQRRIGAQINKGEALHCEAFSFWQMRAGSGAVIMKSS
jgi:TnpA family transposase